MLIVKTQADPRLYIFCSQVRNPVSTHGKNKYVNENALIALPCHIPDTHRSYNGFPVSVKFVWWEKLHEGALRRSLHIHCIREVATKHTQHNLSEQIRGVRRRQG
jgi:hypothetical protein